MLDKFADFIQKLQNIDTSSERNGGNDIKSAIKDGYNELKQGTKLESNKNQSENKKDLNGKVEISPVSIDSQVKVSLEGDQLTVKIDDTDLKNTKIALEEAFNAKIEQIKEDIYTQIKDFVNETVSNETQSNPVPSKFRSNNQYNLG
jgi:hypothetical protein